jgi:hypothetical protein
LDDLAAVVLEEDTLVRFTSTTEGVVLVAAVLEEDAPIRFTSTAEWVATDNIAAIKYRLWMFYWAVNLSNRLVL